MLSRASDLINAMSVARVRRSDHPNERLWSYCRITDL